MPIIAANTSSQFVYISNNLINVSGSYTSYNYGIYFLNYKNSTVSRNFVLNNTINSTGNMQYGLLFDPAPTNGYTEVYNNLIIAPTGNFPGIGGAIGPVAASFNYMNAPLSLSNTFDNGTNNTSSNTTLDINGRQIAGSDVINGASPDFAYYDLDLSVGDAGAFGGSFTLDNFFPITGSTRVYMVYAPRRVNVSGTINIKADGFDR